jgi:hypothetical protein
MITIKTLTRNIFSFVSIIVLYLFLYPLFFFIYEFPRITLWSRFLPNVFFLLQIMYFVKDLTNKHVIKTSRKIIKFIATTLTWHFAWLITESLIWCAWSSNYKFFLFLFCVPNISWTLCKSFWNHKLLIQFPITLCDMPWFITFPLL